MSFYFNENDPYAAAWLRNLYPSAVVDERSIVDVSPDDLVGYRHCAFFAGIAGWQLALELAEWPTDREVWTGSCPCQPFSSAGAAQGLLDARHLWPAFHRLIAECRPPVVFGEQVASADGRAWLAGVRTDLEDLGYAVGAADLCAAGVGAPHIRQRLYWVAYADGGERRAGRRCFTSSCEASPERRGDAFGLAHTGRERVRAAGPRPDAGAPGRVQGADGQRQRLRADAGAGGESAGGLEHAPSDGRQQRRAEPGGRGAEPRRGAGGLADADGQHDDGARSGGRLDCGQRQCLPATGSLADGAGFWSDAILISCADGRSRRISPSIQPLASRLPAAMDGRGPISRVGALKAAGNAIVPPLAAVFIRAVMEVIDV